MLPFRHRRRHPTRAPRLASVSVVLVLSTTACMASKGDVRVLQDELRALRSSIAQTDTARRAQADTAMMLISRANDSLRLLSTRFSTFQANVTGGTQAPAANATVPLGRYGNADDIAQAALFLCSPASNWITGTSLDISGGMWMD